MDLCVSAETKGSGVALAVVVALLVLCVITLAVVTVVSVRKLCIKVLARFSLKIDSVAKSNNNRFDYEYMYKFVTTSTCLTSNSAKQQLEFHVRCFISGCVQ